MGVIDIQERALPVMLAGDPAPSDWTLMPMGRPLPSTPNFLLGDGTGLEKIVHRFRGYGTREQTAISRRNLALIVIQIRAGIGYGIRRQLFGFRLLELHQSLPAFDDISV